MDEKRESTDRLEDIFQQACAAAPLPSAALLARVMADAEAELAARALPLPPAAPARGAAVGGFWAGALALVGGWRALGGLASATLAGVWIGFAGADGLSGVAADLLTGGATATLATVNLLPGDDVFALAMGLEETQ